MMALIYANATLTIASSCAASSHDGFLRQRDTDYSPPLPLRSPKTGTSGNFYLRPTAQRLGELEHHRNQPLQRRAWTYQERLLSPRTVFYDADQLVWECNAGMVFESDAGRVRQDYFAQAFGKLGGAFGERRRGSAEQMAASLSFSKESPRIRRVEGEEVYVRWYKILEEFGNRELTFRDDALPAISGIAATFASLKGDTYLGGIWVRDFPRGLCWELKPKSADASISVDKVSDRSHFAPTWSWASLLGGRRRLKAFGLERAKRLESEHEAVLVKWSSQPLGEDPMGQLRYCHLWIRGWCRPVYVSSGANDASQGISVAFKEHEGLSISTTLDELDIDAEPMMPAAEADGAHSQPPQLLCLALGEWSTARHFIAPTLYCLIIKATGENDVEYTRIGTMKIEPPLDPVKAAQPPQ
jgi:hypothetical protein